MYKWWTSGEHCSKLLFESVEFRGVGTVRSFWDVVRTIGEMSFPVGETDDGNLIFRSFNDIPHLLVSGATGTGKSVFLHSFLASLIMRNSPESLRFILYDSKIVELFRYTGEPHLFLPVMTESRKLRAALDWCGDEIEKRLMEFALNGKRSLSDYNLSVSEKQLPIFPRVIIVADDLSVAMAETPKLAGNIRQIFLKGRTAGFHLILVTQTTTGREIRRIAELVPSKLVFSTTTEKESTFLIGNKSARQLGPFGTAIFSAFRGSSIKVNTIMAEDGDIDNILTVSKKMFEKYTLSSEILERLATVDLEEERQSYIESDTGPDELLPAAVDFVLETGQASVTMIQRGLKLGYSRAARLVDQMEEMGIVGLFEGSKPRKILITRKQWEDMKRG